MRATNLVIEKDIKDAAADVRSEMVARGRVLIADPNYPSKEQIHGMAALLARHWRGEAGDSSLPESIESLPRKRSRASSRCPFVS